MQTNTNRSSVVEATTVEDRSCSMWLAQLSVLLAAPAVVLLAAVHVVVYGWASLAACLWFYGQWWLLLPVLVVGLVAHELIHGLTWAWLSKRPLRDIRFGFQLRSLTPFAHMKVPIPAGAYRLDTAMQSHAFSPVASPNEVSSVILSTTGASSAGVAVTILTASTVPPIGAATSSSGSVFLTAASRGVG